MKVVVTGARGQLGQTLRELISQRDDIQPVYVDIDELDLTDKERVEEFFENIKADAIVNCAAYTAVDRAESEPELAEKVNTVATGNLADAARKNGAKLIHISTDYVFNGEGGRPYKESDPTDPQTVYGRTKLEGERLMQELNPEAIIIRTAWLYSLYGKNFYLTMREKALGGERVRVVNDQHGSPTFAGDLAKAILEILTANRWVPGIYHFTNEGATTWFDFTREIYRTLGADPDLVEPVSSEEFKSAARRPRYSVLNKLKIKDTYRLTIPKWEESLRTLHK